MRGRCGAFRSITLLYVNGPSSTWACLSQVDSSWRSGRAASVVACSMHRSLAFVTTYPREEEVAHLSVLPSPVASSSHDSSNNRLTQLETSTRSEQHGSPTAGKEEGLHGSSATGDGLSGVHELTGNSALGGGRSCVAPAGPCQAPSVDRGVGASMPQAGPVPPADRAVATDPLMMQAAASLRDGAKGEQVLSTPVCMAEQDIDLHNCQAPNLSYVD